MTPAFYLVVIFPGSRVSNCYEYHGEINSSVVGLLHLVKLCACGVCQGRSGGLLNHVKMII